jgi:transcriptional regulator with XRE-family HTH domain
MNARQQVLPIKPLLDLTELLSPTDTASLCGVSRVTVYRWRRGESASIAVHDADRIAIRLGMHPAQLWGDDWWDIPAPTTDAERKRAWRQTRAAAQP